MSGRGEIYLAPTAQSGQFELIPQVYESGVVTAILLLRGDQVDRHADVLRQGAARQQLVKELKELEKNMGQADERIKALFEEQDELLKNIEECDSRIEKYNAEIAGLEKEKQASIKVVERDQPVPMLRISKRIYAGNRIAGTQAHMMIKDDVGNCKFVEIDSGDANNPKVIQQQNM